MEQLGKIAEIANEPFHLQVCKTPLQKHVISIFGQQSSGKSSLITYLFGNLPVREIAATSTDDKYTIIEAIPEAEFKEICGGFLLTSFFF